jgi:hypothetical protein
MPARDCKVAGIGPVRRARGYGRCVGTAANQEWVCLVRSLGHNEEKKLTAATLGSMIS